MTSSEQDALHELMKKTAVALKQAQVPFALCGGYAAWARGAPEPEHNADFVVLADQAERAAKALTEADLRVVEPAEDWLFKVVEDEETFVDVLWEVSGHRVDAGLVERASGLQVLAARAGRPGAGAGRDRRRRLRRRVPDPAGPAGHRAGGFRRVSRARRSSLAGDGGNLCSERPAGRVVLPARVPDDPSE